MFDERGCGVGLFGLGANRGGEHQRLLEFSRHQTGVIDAGDTDQRIADEQRKLGLAFGDGLRHLLRFLLRLDLGLHLLADAKTLEHADEMLAVDAVRQERNGLRVEQRLLERRGRAHVRLRCASAHGGAEAHFGHSRALATREKSLLGRFVHRAGHENGDIEKFARFDLFHKDRRRRVGHGQLVAGRAFELRNDVLECPGEGANRQHLELRRLRGRMKRKQT